MPMGDRCSSSPMLFSSAGARRLPRSSTEVFEGAGPTPPYLSEYTIRPRSGRNGKHHLRSRREWGEGMRLSTVIVVLAAGFGSAGTYAADATRAPFGTTP